MTPDILIRENRLDSTRLKRIAETGEITGIDARDYVMDRGSMVLNAAYLSRRAADRAYGRSRHWFWNAVTALRTAIPETQRISRAAMGYPDWVAREKFDEELRAHAKLKTHTP